MFICAEMPKEPLWVWLLRMMLAGTGASHRGRAALPAPCVPSDLWKSSAGFIEARISSIPGQCPFLAPVPAGWGSSLSQACPPSPQGLGFALWHCWLWPGPAHIALLWVLSLQLLWVCRWFTGWRATKNPKSFLVQPKDEQSKENPLRWEGRAGEVISDRDRTGA